MFQVITAILPGRYTVPIEFPNVKALTIVEGEMRFDLNYSVFNCSYQTHSIATTMNCFGLEALEFVDSLLNNRISLPFWAVRVRDGLEVIGYMLNRPYPIKWNIVSPADNGQRGQQRIREICDAGAGEMDGGLWRRITKGIPKQLE